MKLSTPKAVPPRDDKSSVENQFVLVRRHLLVGWWALLVFLTLGLVLESLHGFKVGMYVKVSNETRRLMWTLAHAHGTLLGLMNLGFAATLRTIPTWPDRGRTFASGSLLGATLLMPAGFFLGGCFIYAGDPGLGILLVPVGGILLFLAAAGALRGVRHLKSARQPGEFDERGSSGKRK